MTKKLVTNTIRGVATAVKTKIAVASIPRIQISTAISEKTASTGKPWVDVDVELIGHRPSIGSTPIPKYLEEWLSIADAVSKEVFKGFNETSTSLDVSVRSIEPLFTEDINTAEAFSRVVSFNLDLTEANTYFLSDYLAENEAYLIYAFNISDELAITIVKSTFIESLVAADVSVRESLKVFNEALLSVDANTKLFNKTLVDITGVTDDVLGVANSDDDQSAQFIKVLDEYSVATDYPSKNPNKAVSDTTSSSESLIIYVQGYFAEGYMLENYTGTLLQI